MPPSNQIFASGSGGLQAPQYGPAPTTKQQRRMTSPSLPPPPNPLGLPEPVGYGTTRDMRPPSPLRHSTTQDDDVQSEDGDDDQGDHPPTFSKYAAEFARSVGSLMSPTKSTSTLPSDAELEAEAQRERDRSRREAERILLQEARDRRRVEERVLAMLEDHSAVTPPAPPRDVSNQGSPTSQKDKDGGWWQVAKSRLTPTKESLTPAQQVIQEAKHKEKAHKKAHKAAAKEEKKAREQAWPAKPNTKYADPAFAALNATSPTRPPALTQGLSQMSTDTEEAPMTPLRPPPRRFSTPGSLNTTPGGGASPASGTVSAPIYAQFDDGGALDVHGTLLVIARRFEKLEKWTVGHVRALEERMSDVERWLVDKEKERESERSRTASQSSDNSHMDAQMESMREEMAELQGRIATLGREMARMATAPPAPAAPAGTPPLARNASGASYAVRFIPPYTHAQRTPSTVSQPSSPPTSSVISTATTSRTRLPYPTGDYTSPTSSPPPGVASPPNVNTVLNELARSDSPVPGDKDREYVLPPPKAPALRDSPRASSVSPTPRKRYTVALGDPITGRKAEEEKAPEESRVETAYYSDMSASEFDSESDIDLAEETIGKAAARRVSVKMNAEESSPSPSPSNFRNRRAKAQSAYGFGAVANSMGRSTNAAQPTAPLRLRSQSTENFNTNITGASASTSNLGLGITADGSSKFIDPYEARKAEREREASIAPPTPKVMTGRKVPVGQLVAFFNKPSPDAGQ